MRYVLFFDQERQSTIATTPEQAVAGCFGFLHCTIETFIDSHSASGGTIVVDEPDNQHNRLKPCSVSHAKWVLENYKALQLYGDTKSHGIVATAAVMEEEEWKRLEQEVDGLEAFAQLKAELRTRGETVDQHIKHIGMIPKISDYPPRDVCPQKILQSAEARIFAHNLYYALSETTRPFIEIEKECGLVKGSLLKMINPFDPLVPDQDMVKQIADALGLQPNSLWYNAIEPYFAHYIPGNETCSTK